MTIEPDQALVRIVVVDGQEIVRHGLEYMINGSDDLNVVGAAPDMASARAVILSQRPDVVVLDMVLPDGNGYELRPWIKEELPQCAVVCLNSHSNQEMIHQAISCGIDGLIPKNADSKTILETIRKAARGQCYVDSDILLAAFHHTQPSSSPLDILSQQESRVLTLMADGMTNREIAERMGLSEKTVKNYSSHMMGKLGVTRRTEAAALYWKHARTQNV